MGQVSPGGILLYLNLTLIAVLAASLCYKWVAPYCCSMKGNIKTENLEPGMMVKTHGNDIVEVFSVRHFNDTVSVGNSRKYPILISVQEIAQIVSE